MYCLYKRGNGIDRDITEEYSNFLFPIEGGKELHKLDDICMGNNQESGD